MHIKRQDDMMQKASDLPSKDLASLYWSYHLLTRWSWVNLKISYPHKWEYLPHRVVKIKWSEKYGRVIYNSKDICRYSLV